MICEETASCFSWPDDWTATMTEEHTSLVPSDGVEALTGIIESSPVQWWEEESEVHKGVWLGTTRAAKKRMEKLAEKASASSS